MRFRLLRAIAIPALLAAAPDCAAQAASAERVLVPWQAGNAARFQAGSPDEGGRQADRGDLPVTILRPQGRGPFPFVVLLHGCGGLRQPAMWSQWVQPWADLLNRNGVGVAVADSFEPRGVTQVCRSNVAAWAVRRADDAYSVSTWLVRQPYVDPARIAVMGMSNGGRTVLAALRTDLRHSAPFRAGIALYPGCQSDVAGRFYGPLLVLAGRRDGVTPAAACEAMAASQPAGARLQLVVYPDAQHTFDMKLPDRTVLGMRLGYDRDATDDARRRVIAFLRDTGVIR